MYSWNRQKIIHTSIIFRAIIYYLSNSSVQLVVDDSPENNGCVNDFLSIPGVQMKKLIAQVDIRQSNSMIEAANKRMKYDYLFRSLERLILKSLPHLLSFVPAAPGYINLCCTTAGDLFFLCAALLK